MIFKLDFLLSSEEKFKAEGRTLPAFVVCDNFESALKTARKFESENATLFEIQPSVPHGNIVVARGYKGLTYNENKESA